MWCQVPAFACGYLVIPAPYVEKTVLSPVNGFGTLFKNRLAKDVCIYFWTLNSIPLHMSVSVLSSTSLSWFLLLCIKFCNQDVWIFLIYYYFLWFSLFWGPLQFHLNFRISLWISTKKSAGILLEIALNICSSVWGTLPSLLTYKHGVSFLNCVLIFSALLYGFQYISLSPYWLGLILSILFFLILWMELFS